MTTIHKTATVPYSAQQMYKLVNDIKAYPEFLSWCSESRVISPGENALSASLTMQAGKIKQSFTTQNTMVPGKEIHVKLIKGPFKHLTGHWLFEDKPNNMCLITLDMSFEYKNSLLKMALSTVFTKIVDSLVDSFTKRAKQLYG